MTTEQKDGRIQHNEYLTARLHKSIQVELNEIMGQNSLSDWDLMRFVSWVVLDAASAENTDSLITEDSITVFLPNKEKAEVVVRLDGAEDQGNSHTQIIIMDSGIISELVVSQQGQIGWKSSTRCHLDSYENMATAWKIFHPYQRRGKSPVSQSAS